MPGNLYVILTPETQAEKYQIKQIKEAALAAGIGDIGWWDHDSARKNGVALQVILDPLNLNPTTKPNER